MRELSLWEVQSSTQDHTIAKIRLFLLLHLLGADEVRVPEQIIMHVSGHMHGRRRKQHGKELVAWTVGD